MFSSLSQPGILGRRNMKVRLLALALGAVISMGLQAGAHAADMGAPVYKAPPPAPPMVFNWTGFYAGVNLGGAWVDFDGDRFDNRNQISGVIGGGQIGANYQINNFVLGIEADIQGSSLSHSNTFFDPAVIGPISATERQRWFGTVRGRFGVAWDRWMVNATGG